MKWENFCYLFITALSFCQSHHEVPQEGRNSSSKEPILKCPHGMKESNCAGCWSKCPVEGMSCEKKDCQSGCACEEHGHVWHNGMCIPASQCPYIPKEGDKCPEGMVWNFCSSCDHYCNVFGQDCIPGCRIGCVCKKEDHRMFNRICQSKFACNEYAFVQSCSKGKKYSYCVKCEQFCFPTSECAKKCTQGCVCEDETLVIYNSNCIKRKDCPRHGIGSFP
ncbi:hemocytin-like isoform X2 [Pyxicephalus adspersus]|uniref:hemocytin-like isoform X2 n=1 Tax=Pyxicephalus adspersus TaxID=30357 RepID=UPI003B5BB07A